MKEENVGKKTVLEVSGSIKDEIKQKKYMFNDKCLTSEDCKEKIYLIENINGKTGKKVTIFYEYGESVRFNNNKSLVQRLLQDFIFN